jgi:hypothetical protein
MNDETILKAIAMLCATIIVAAAFMVGHDGHLALTAVILLFGGEKLLAKVKTGTGRK